MVTDRTSRDEAGAATAARHTHLHETDDGPTRDDLHHPDRILTTDRLLERCPECDGVGLAPGTDAECDGCEGYGWTDAV